ncbi:S8 family serine peptidase [Kordia sp. YSTF-M3]|uniref:S8 family serine peptidase n=1 Tax=Kordia aestuariivivens TaxID=2759037 RepID=A0ABR7Q4R9_9FLAO|nr:S8 family serine peptidase [Kordia aestuariivivens]MBC8753557.1 S8 family serine peptidase [Kordia aestuariivivens]
MFLSRPYLLIFLICFFGCVNSKLTKQNYTEKLIFVDSVISKKNKFTDANLENWHHKDIMKDTIPGISIEKAYEKLLSNKKEKKKIVVALIDSELDIDHEDLKNQIWFNKNEIPNNGIDDDENGYVDDINGWNYIGTNLKDEVPYTSLSSTRIIKKYKSKFKDLPIEKIDSKDIKHYKKYLDALRIYNLEMKIRNDDIAMYNRMIKKHNAADKFLDSVFKGNYSLKQLDSLKNVSDKKEKTYDHANNMHYYLKYDYNPNWLNNQIIYQTKAINTLLSFDYNDRSTTNDDPYNLQDISYGNNNIQGTRKLKHATKVASILGASRGNNIGIDGIIDSIKIMSLGVTAAGDEFDKDIALAIRYAVDNGATIINMSIGRELSLYPEWVDDAMKYAASKDVLIITSAGNNGYNLDEKTNYPNDSYDSKEFITNFIKVGSISYKLDSTLVNNYSNYGKKEVDVFAPGTAIYTNTRSNPSFTSGTSYSTPIVTGIAALIRAYYPNLSAAEVKEIILKSGIELDVLVFKPFPDGEKKDPKKVPFSSLSKSGKIVNAYNALLMAEEVSKKKKK